MILWFHNQVFNLIFHVVTGVTLHCSGKGKSSLVCQFIRLHSFSIYCMCICVCTWCFYKYD